MKRKYTIPQILVDEITTRQMLNANSIIIHDKENSPTVENSNQVFSRRDVNIWDEDENDKAEEYY